MVPEPPPAELAPSCAEAGVLGVLPGIIGSIQALEAIKLILGLGEPLIGRILTFDTTDMAFREFKLRPDPANEVTYANRDRIEIRDLDGLCAPGSPLTRSHVTLSHAGHGVTVQLGSVRISASIGASSSRSWISTPTSTRAMPSSSIGDGRWSSAIQPIEQGGHREQREQHREAADRDAAHRELVDAVADGVREHARRAGTARAAAGTSRRRAAPGRPIGVIASAPIARPTPSPLTPRSSRATASRSRCTPPTSPTRAG